MTEIIQIELKDTLEELNTHKRTSLILNKRISFHY